MKAAVFKEVGKPLVIEDVPDTTPDASELVIKVSYCGICGTDLHSTREGLMTVGCDQVLGHEYVGEIVEVGKEAVGSWEIGDRVCAIPLIGCGHCRACANGRIFECQTKKTQGIDSPGAFAQYVATGSRETIKLPDSLEMEAAALIEPLAVGLHAVRVGDVKAGDRVMVIGAGPIGLTAALWSRFLGAKDVVVTELAATRAALAKKMGATHVIQPDLSQGSEHLLEQFIAVSGGPPDVIIECVGAPGLMQQCMEMASQRGKVVVVGVCEQPDSIMPFYGLIKELSIQFAIAYTRDDFDTCVAMLAEGRIDVSPMITDVIDLDELPEAFEALRTPSHQCKVLTRIV